MSNVLLLIYLQGLSDKVCTTLFVAFIVTSFAFLKFILRVMMLWADRAKQAENTHKVAKYLLILWLSLASLLAILPKQKFFDIYIAMTITKEIANIPVVSRLGEKSLKLIESYIDEALEQKESIPKSHE